MYTFAVMKFLALALSCLILALSAGAGDVVSRDATAAADMTAECCGGCCCPCGGADAADAGHGDSCGGDEKGCPFCLCNTCPGFAAVIAASVSATGVEFRSEKKCVFVPHTYISPSVDGIWQPPRAAVFS
jgi:hypothetical protein